MKKFPKISVNIPLITNGDASIVLESLKRIRYPKDLVEVIIVEGNQIAKQRNVALIHSTGKIIYLLDDDSKINPQAFKLLASEFLNTKVAAVGGPSLSRNKSNYFSKLVGYVLETYFGAVRMRFRYSPQLDKKGSEYRFVGANLALRRNAVLKVGKFNERIVPNEESELIRRLKKAGYQLKYNRKLFIYRDQRNNIVKLFKQFHHYGVGRMKQILHNFNPDDILFIAPIAFLFYLVSLIVYHPIWYLIPLSIYLILGILTSLKASIKYRNFSLFPSMIGVFPLIHLSYAFGLIHELMLPNIIKSGRKNVTGIKILTLSQITKESGPNIISPHKGFSKQKHHKLNLENKRYYKKLI